MIVEPIRSLEFFWGDYSFVIANPWAIDELWPPKPSVPAASVAPSTSQVTQLDATEDASSANLTDPAVATKIGDTESKMKRSKWVRSYLANLTEEQKKDLKCKYQRIGDACVAINQLMKADPKVDPYEKPRAIEPFLAELYPVRRKGRP